MISTSLFSIDAMSAVRGRWIIKVAHIVPVFRVFIFHSPDHSEARPHEKNVGGEKKTKAFLAVQLIYLSLCSQPPAKTNWFSFLLKQMLLNLPLGEVQ